MHQARVSVQRSAERRSARRARGAERQRPRNAHLATLLLHPCSPLPPPPKTNKPTALGLVFLPSLLGFVALDLFWIAVVARDLYAGLKPVLKPQPDAAAAALSWLCIAAGNYFFVLPRTGGPKSAWATVGLVSVAVFGAAAHWCRGVVWCVDQEQLCVATCVHRATHSPWNHHRHPTSKTHTQGALFGLLLYGTVDLTNCALIEHWSRSVAAVDMVWGALASALLALAQRTLASAFPSLGLM